MSFLNSISALISNVTSAVKPIFSDFVTERKEAREEKIKQVKEWFEGLSKPIADTVEKAVDYTKDKQDAYERKHDLAYFLDEDGEIKSPLEYDNTDEGKAQAQKDAFLLGNFFKEPTVNDEGKIVFELNEYGRILAGEDGIISKDELMALDNILKNGKVSQKEVNNWKKSVEEQAQELRQPTDLMAFLDEDGFLPTKPGYVYTEEGKAQIEHDSFLLIALYEAVETDLDTGGVGYTLNKYGLALAGEDGKISKEELMALDTDGDGKVTKEEVDAWKEKQDAAWEEEAEPTDLAALLGEDDMLPSSISYDISQLSDADKAALKKYHILIDNFMEDKNDDKSKVELKYNDYGLALAGEDGKISKEELMALDANKDGKITQDEIDAWKEKVDADNEEKENPTSLATYAEKYGELKSPLEYSDSEADKTKLEYDKLLLETLYTKVETEDGSIKYEFNDYAKKIAGEDGKISKEELMALDANKDGKVTKEEISAAEQEEKQPSNIASFLDKDGNLPKAPIYKDNEAGKADIEHDKNLLDAFYELDTETNKYAKGSVSYKLSEYGKALAGEDGVISKEELMALDTDKDGKVSTDEIAAWKAGIDKENEEKNPTSLLTYLKEYGEIKSPMVYDTNTDEGKDKLEHDKLLLDALFTKTKDKDGEVTYRFNEQAYLLASKDGKITSLSEEELMKLDMDNDGKVSAEEADKFSKMNVYEKLKLIYGKEIEEDSEE